MRVSMKTNLTRFLPFELPEPKFSEDNQSVEPRATAEQSQDLSSTLNRSSLQVERNLDSQARPRS